MLVFIAEKHFEPCSGIELHDEIKLTIAAQACLLLMDIQHDYYRNVNSILVYPDSFITRHQHRSGALVIESDVATLGQAHDRGPVIISWADAKYGAANCGDGRNVVIHEFAHKLDMIDGWIDGTPRIRDRRARDRWISVMSEHYRQLQDDLDRGRRTLLGSYAATNVGEFFAVATEIFFEKPHRLKREHPELFDVLQQFYQQDPRQYAR